MSSCGCRCEFGLDTAAKSRQSSCPSVASECISHCNSHGLLLIVGPLYIVIPGNFSGTKKTEEIMVARGSMLELLRIEEDKLVRAAPEAGYFRSTSLVGDWGVSKLKATSGNFQMG